MISIVIPTLNGGDLFQEVLQSIDMQQIGEDYELLVVDSSSTDTTVQMAEKFGAKIFSIKREDFDHGGTRTMAALQAKGEILVFMTQDAVLASPQSLAQLIAPLRENGTTAVSYGRQLPSENATPSAVHLRLFNYPESSLRRSYDDRKVYGLKTAFVSNSFAAYKKEMLKEVGFFQDGLVFGEDTCTVGRLLRNGGDIQYVSQATVYHSHNYSMLEEFKRYFDIGVLHSSEKWLLQEYGKAEGHGAGYVKSAVGYYLQTGVRYLLPDMFVRCGVKYMAYKLGRSYKRLPNALRKKFSMNGSWWLKNN